MKWKPIIIIIMAIVLSSSAQAGIWDDLINLFSSPETIDDSPFTYVNEGEYFGLVHLSGLQKEHFDFTQHDQGNNVIKTCAWPKTEMRINDPIIIQSRLRLLDYNGAETFIEPSDTEVESEAGNVLKFCYDVNIDIYEQLRYGDSSALFTVYNQSFLSFTENNNTRINVTIKKWVAGQWVYYPDLAFTGGSDGVYKYGWNDSSEKRKSWERYKIVLKSEQPLDMQNAKEVVRYYENGTIKERYWEGGDYYLGDYKLDFSDICDKKNYNKTLKSHCKIRVHPNKHLSKIVVTFNSNKHIDPYIIATTRNSKFDDSHYEFNDNFAHISINHSSERYLNLKGSDDYVYFTRTPNHKLNNELSFSFWMKTNVTYIGTGMHLIGLYNDVAPIYYVRLYDAGRLRFHLLGLTDPDAHTTGAENITDNEWHHIGFTYNGSATHIYVDGEPVFTEATSGTITDNSNYVMFGRNHADLDEYFYGDLDEIMFFNKALSNDDMLYLNSTRQYHENKSFDGNLIGWYDFDNHPTNRNDKSATGRTITYDEAFTEVDKDYNYNEPYANLAAYYNFDIYGSTYNDFYDESDGNIDLSDVRPLQDNSTWNYDNFLSFSGSNDYVAAADDYLPTRNISAAGWINVNETINNQTILVYGNPTSNISRFEIALRDETSGCIGVTTSNKVLALSIGDQGLGDGKTNILCGNTQLSTDTWYHFVANLYNGREAELYLNSAEEAGNNLDNNHTIVAWGDLFIGKDFTSNNRTPYLNGSLDEIMIFEQPLSQNTIKEIYNSTSRRYKGEGFVTIPVIDLGNNTVDAMNVTLDNGLERNNVTNVSVRFLTWMKSQGYNTTDIYGDNLIAYLTADQSPFDITNHSYMTFGGDANADERGMFNNSFVLDGTDAFVVIGNDSHYNNLREKTISLWIKPTVLSNYVSIISKTSNNSIGWDLRFYSVIGDQAMIQYVRHGATNFACQTARFDLKDKWTHVVLVQADTNTRQHCYIYVNGRVALANPSSNGGLPYVNDSAYPIILGGNSLVGGSTISDDFTGYIDDVQIYNYSMTPEQIKDLHTYGKLVYNYSEWFEYQPNVTIPVPWNSSNLVTEFRLDSNNEEFYSSYIYGDVTLYDSDYFPPTPPDTEAPSITDVGETPTDPQTWSDNLKVSINATITDATNSTFALIEWDGINYTMDNTSTEFNMTFNDIAAGVYTYYIWANDSLGNAGSTSNYTYTINVATPNIKVNITPSNSEVEGTQTNASGFGCPAQITCNLFRNGAGVSNPDIQTLAVGTYNYTYNTTGNANYTAWGVSNELNITAIPPPPPTPDYYYLDYRDASYNFSLPDAVCFGLRAGDICFNETGWLP